MAIRSEINPLEYSEYWEPKWRQDQVHDGCHTAQTGAPCVSGYKGRDQ